MAYNVLQMRRLDASGTENETEIEHVARSIKHFVYSEATSRQSFQHMANKRQHCYMSEGMLRWPLLLV